MIGSVEPLAHVSCLVPTGRPDWALGRGREEVRFVSVLPEVQTLRRDGFAGKRNGFQQCLPPSRVVSAQTQVEAMGEFDFGPGTI